MIKLLEFMACRIMNEMDKQNAQTPRKIRLNRDALSIVIKGLKP